MAGPTVEIRVRDGDEENSIFAPVKDMSRRWVDAHRMRQAWDDDEPLAAMALNYLRGMARDDLIPRRLPNCTVVIVLALLYEVAEAKEIARVSAALAVPGTILEVCLSEEMPAYGVSLAEVAGAVVH